MSRVLIPGSWDHSGRAVRLTGYAHCTGGCHGGRRACDCTTGCVELSSDVAPDASRTFGPAPFSTTNADRGRWLFRIVVAAALMAALIDGFPH
jgi:hypothetical protein